MSLSTRLTCPHCQTTAKVRGEAGSIIRVPCPNCSQTLKVKIPSAARPPAATPAKKSSPSDPLDDLSDDLPLPPSPLPQRRTAAPRRRGSKRPNPAIGIAIAGGTVAVLLLVAAVSFFSGAPSGLDDIAGPNSAESGDSTNVAPKIVSDTPEEIIDEYFQMLIASEETGEHFAPQPGSEEYELRVARYIAGEERSRDLMQRALFVDATDKPKLEESYRQRRREFFDRYKFGTSTVSEVEDRVRNDPRIVDRKWKELLKRYIDESFFGLPEPETAQSSQDYVAYIETLGAVARELAQIDSGASVAGIEARLKAPIDSIIQYAAKSVSSNAVTFVKEDHKRAEYTFLRLNEAYAQELRAEGIDSEELINAIEDYRFAVKQVSQPDFRSGDKMTAALAARRAQRDPAQPKVTEQSQATPTQSPEPGNAPRQQPQQTPAFRAERGGPSPQERFDFRRRQTGNRPGPQRPSEQMASPADRKAAVIARYEGPHYLRIIIEGEGNTVSVAQDYLKEVGIEGSFIERSGSTTTVHASDPRNPQELADQITFGKVNKVDNAQRTIHVSYSFNQ